MYIDHREQTEQGAVLHLAAQVVLLGKGADGTPMSLQLAENFTMECDTPKLCAESLPAIPSAVIEGDRVKVRLQGRMDGFGIASGKSTYVGAVLSAEDELRSGEDAMTLCYPSQGETLWEIAKRYRTTQAALLSANHLGEGELPAVLLIPRG